jgi:hypothetical protein
MDCAAGFAQRRLRTTRLGTVQGHPGRLCQCVAGGKELTPQRAQERGVLPFLRALNEHQQTVGLQGQTLSTEWVLVLALAGERFRIREQRVPRHLA